ncbi:MAG: PAS domain S-box protein [Myxococcales bacterium]|nr:PAS domain S-box protein [Myxococcales bacterium]
MPNTVHPSHYLDELLQAFDSFEFALMVFQIKAGVTTRWFVNRAGAALTGYTPAEMMSLPMLGTVMPSDRGRVGKLMHEASTGQAQAGVVAMVVQHKLGHRIPVEVSFVVQQRAEDTLIFSWTRDISAENKQQLRFIEADRRQLIANIASGLAHEVFNPLTYVQLNIGRIQRALDVGDDTSRDQLRTLLAQIDHGLSRVIDTVQKVGELTGMHPVEATTCCLVRVVQTALALLEPNILARASVTSDLLAAPIDVIGEPSRVGQAVFNALLFAAGDGGLPEARREVGVRMYREGDFIVLAVSDNGPSLTDTELVHVFQPFMPTGRSAEGTGLAVARGLVEQTGGYVYASSAPPGGVQTKLAFRVAPANVLPSAADA